MIKDNQTYFNRLHVVLDALITVGSYILAWFIRIVVFSSPGEVLPKETYFAALYFILPGYLLLFHDEPVPLEEVFLLLERTDRCH